MPIPKGAELENRDVNEINDHLKASHRVLQFCVWRHLSGDDWRHFRYCRFRLRLRMCWRSLTEHIQTIAYGSCHTGECLSAKQHFNSIWFKAAILDNVVNMCRVYFEGVSMAARRVAIGCCRCCVDAGQPSSGVWSSLASRGCTSGISRQGCAALLSTVDVVRSCGELASSASWRLYARLWDCV